MLKLDGLDKAFMGVASRFGMDDVFAYDLDKVLKILIERDGMSPDEALEFFHYNIIGAWMGDTTPLFVKRYNSIEDAVDDLGL
tara:strand:+ start:73 stop:321 length:249 start_codon:yes stop_codon:yes gene_type:complete